jgi:DtxR family Mn-dependent transcriptional regulator
MGVKDSSVAFLKYLDSSGIQLGTLVEVVKKEAFDQSMHILFEGKKRNISQQISKNLFVKKHRL